MSRNSFDTDDEASFRPYNPSQPTQHFQSARGQGGYSVSSGTAYAPPREATASPASEMHYGAPATYSAPTAYHNSQTNHRQDPEFQQPTQTNHQPTGQRTLLDSSPHRQQPPPAPAHRDPYANAAPIPPPHRGIDPSEPADHYRRPAAAAGVFGGGAVGAAMADTSYHGAHDMHDLDNDDPFQDGAADDSLRGPTHGYPSYPPISANHDPFASSNRHYSDTTGPAIGMGGPNSYEMRPPIGQRPSSYTDPYGHGMHNNSQGDLGSFDPRDIADDEDDTAYLPKRRAAAASAGAGAGAAGILGSRDASGKYGQVPGGDPEKSARAKNQGTGRSGKRTMWMVGSVIAFVIALAIIGGVVGGVLVSNNSKKGSSTQDKDNGPDLTKDSADIKALMNNPDLHRIFPAMDYTPFNAQYPECLSWAPSQNNVTKDVAVLSQLAPQIRLYGNDCNQTEMVLHAIDKLDMKNSMKVWLGVDLEKNQTTNDRQLAQMWNIIDTYDQDSFAGLIVGNEVLFTGFLTASGLADLLDTVRQNLTSKGIKFPLASSDLGSNWNTSNPVTKAVDIVMGNVHPFFGGVEVAQAASWTSNYFTANDVAAAAVSRQQKALISEVGWPSANGAPHCTDPLSGKSMTCAFNYCADLAGLNTTCASSSAGAVAGIDQMNTFLADWACQALENGTSYFWFEAFDEPWKIKFNSVSDGWETQWGLMDPGRKIKPGLKIPDCGGKTAG